MIKKAKILAALFVVLSLWTGNLRAEIVTIYLTAEVTHVDDLTDLLEDKVNVGDAITGSYSYDSDTPDTNPLDTVGDYWHYNAPYGFNLSSDFFVFQTDPDNVNFLVEIANSHIPPPDGYLLRSYSNLPLSNGVHVDHISWLLDDYSGTALSSIALPTTPPVLEDWEYDWGLRISFGDRGSSMVIAEVTSVVPEPTTFLLLSLGSLLLTRRRR